ncbi:MAG: hypothetical protein Q8P35_01280 [Candidatus Yanofskybacteria bacterium]|nr:hypothetical protein [Candidatus Yanofskybacteria bacterium]
MTSEEVVRRAVAGEITKQELAGLLQPNKRKSFMEVCTSDELIFTKTCMDSGTTPVFPTVAP